ncbi:MAG: hypothetical protein ACLFQK_04105 [Fibrobacterota bacterium]
MSYSVMENYKPGIDRLQDTEVGSSVLIKKLGAEVISYKIKSPSGEDIPLMWNDGLTEPPSAEDWKGHATVLFPIVGGLKENKSIYKGKPITMPSNHGFARKTELETESVNEEGEASITYVLRSSSETRKYYPFDFVFLLKYALRGDKLEASFTVRNTGTGDLPCQFGWHPGFSCSFGAGGKKEDCQVLFNETSAVHYGVLPPGNDSFLTGEKEEVRLGGAYKWTESGLDATYMFDIPEESARTCTLFNPLVKRGVRVVFHDFPQLGLWANPGQNYICVEPWQGMDDHDRQEAFEDKVGMIFIKAGDEVCKKAEIAPVFSL